MTSITWIAFQSADKSSRLLSNVLPWLILLIGVIVAGGVVMYVVRRSLNSERTASQGFTLQDLRDMHAAGELSDEEFERAKAMMIGRLAGPSQPEKTDSPTGNQKQSPKDA